MAYNDLVDDIRDALGVTSAHDVTVSAALRRVVRQLLRNYNFPKSVIRYETPVFAVGARSAALPTECGKIKNVRLVDRRVTPYLYKRLRRREEGVIPYVSGPEAYYIEGGLIYLDTALPEAGHVVELWYQTLDPALVETWMSTEYEDVLFHFAAFEAAPLVRKPELQQAFGQAMQVDIQILGPFLHELEWGDMDLTYEHTPAFRERYPANVSGAVG